ncbi:MAG: pyruvate kinase [Patescibacteria group bacterium]|nr:pyruvate kinase [Patescibacteria group bacterium]
MIKKQTKIVATISSENCAIDFIKKLHHEGVDVVRLNTAHQTPEESSLVVKNVRAASERLAILVDTKGPEMRTLPFENGNLVIKKGDIIKVAGAKTGFSSEKLLLVNFHGLVEKTPKGAMILIDDGETALLVTGKKNDALLCEVQNDGVIKGKKSINIPGVELNLPSLSAKDKSFISWAIKEDIDFIAHSFVRNDKDVVAIQKMLDAKKSPIKIIAKIENQAGVDNIDKILNHAYGIMVARGDLGVEIPMEEVPFVQKMLIKKCVERQKPVITATQMLHTMIDNPRPTRAEVSDVTNALLDGTDAIMLSGETAYGKHPISAVKTMSKIAGKVDRMKSLVFNASIRDENKAIDYLSKSAVKAAEELGVEEIIVSDLSNFSVEVLSSYRPTVPLFVKCSDKKRVRELSLSYGVNAHYIEPAWFKEDLLTKVLSDLVKKQRLYPKDIIVYLSGDEKSKYTSCNMEICEVAKYIKK